MGGMTITGLFAGGGTAVCTWVNGGGNAGGCTASTGGRGFQLALNGDTFSASWFLTNILGANLLSLTFDGPAGFTVFDRATGFLGLSEGTAGSSLGKDASGSTSSAVGGSVSYNNQVGTMGNVPVGDLYAQLVMTFDGGGLTVGTTADWVLDTDNLGLRGGTPGSGVPEPGTFGLMGAALAGLAGLATRRRVTRPHLRGQVARKS
jgi:hypothetical protein